MYVPAPLPVSLCHVHANFMKHEVKTGSKTCPPPLNEIGTQKISDNIMKINELALLIGICLFMTTTENIFFIVSKYVKLKRGSYYLTCIIDYRIFYYYMVVRYCYYHSILCKWF